MKRIIEVRIPDGEIVKVDVTKRYWKVTPELLEELRVATREAGDGEVLRFYEIDDRPAGTDEIIKLKDKLAGAEESSYYDPARIIKARKALDEAKAKYPEAVKCLTPPERVIDKDAVRRAMNMED